MNLIIKIVLIMFSMLLVFLYLFPNEKSCSEKTLYNDKFIRVVVSHKCWGGASGGVDAEVSVISNKHHFNIFKTYAKDGKLCVKQINKNYFYSVDIPLSKLYYINKVLKLEESNITFKLKKDLTYNHCKNIF